MKKLSFLMALILVLSLSAFAVSAEDSLDEYVVYENDFSDAATLNDFTQYIVAYAIQDGKLVVTGPQQGDDTGSVFGFIIYNGTEKYKNFKVDVDVENVQTSTGIVIRSDNTKCSADNGNCFAGYLGFISNNAQSGAMGRTGADYTSWGGNYSGSVIAAGTFPGDDLHFCATCIGDDFNFVISDLKTGDVLYNNTVTNTDWTEGTFGLRTRLSNGADNSVGNLRFDNLKVTVLGEEATALKQGAQNPVVTDAPVTDAPATEAPVTEAPATTVPGEIQTPQTGSNDMIVIAVSAAAVIACAAIVIVRRKVNG